jgi:hypothetical protein
MLSAVLRTPVAVAASINVVRAFNRLRQLSLTHKDLTAALTMLENQVKSHGTVLRDHRAQPQELFAAVKQIL